MGGANPTFCTQRTPAAAAQACQPTGPCCWRLSLLSASAWQGWSYQRGGAAARSGHGTPYPQPMATADPLDNCPSPGSPPPPPLTRSSLSQPCISHPSLPLPAGPWTLVDSLPGESLRRRLAGVGGGGGRGGGPTERMIFKSNVICTFPTSTQISYLTFNILRTPPNILHTPLNILRTPFNILHALSSLPYPKFYIHSDPPILTPSHILCTLSNILCTPSNIL